MLYVKAWETYSKTKCKQYKIECTNHKLTSKSEYQKHIVKFKGHKKTQSRYKQQKAEISQVSVYLKTENTKVQKVPA